jgi:hypothetical protein
MPLKAKGHGTSPGQVILPKHAGVSGIRQVRQLDLLRENAEGRLVHRAHNPPSTRSGSFPPTPDVTTASKLLGLD